jgi:hypothetical protein
MFSSARVLPVLLEGVINEKRFEDGRGRGSYPEKLRNTTKPHISTAVMQMRFEIMDSS